MRARDYINIEMIWNFDGHLFLGDGVEFIDTGVPHGQRMLIGQALIRAVIPPDPRSKQVPTQVPNYSTLQMPRRRTQLIGTVHFVDKAHRWCHVRKRDYRALLSCRAVELGKCAQVAHQRTQSPHRIQPLKGLSYLFQTRETPSQHRLIEQTRAR